MLRLNFILAFLFISSAARLAHATPVTIDAIEPTSVCDRFVTEKKKQACLKTIRQSSADSYLAAICEKQAESQGLYECMGLAAKFDFDPKKIQTCANEELADADRVRCLQSAGTSLPALPERAPASGKKSRKSKKQQQKER